MEVSNWELGVQFAYATLFFCGILLGVPPLIVTTLRNVSPNRRIIAFFIPLVFLFIGGIGVIGRAFLVSVIFAFLVPKGKSPSTESNSEEMNACAQGNRISDSAEDQVKSEVQSSSNINIRDMQMTEDKIKNEEKPSNISDIQQNQKEIKPKYMDTNESASDNRTIDWMEELILETEMISGDIEKERLKAHQCPECKRQFEPDDVDCPYCNVALYMPRKYYDGSITVRHPRNNPHFIAFSFVSSLFAVYIFMFESNFTIRMILIGFAAINLSIGTFLACRSESYQLEFLLAEFEIPEETKLKQLKNISSMRFGAMFGLIIGAASFLAALLL